MSSTFTCPHEATYVWDKDDRATFQATAAITIIVIPATIILNVLLIVAVARKKMPRNNTCILLASMAVADLLIGSIAMPLTASIDVMILRNFSVEIICKLDYVSLIFFYAACCSSLYHLTVVAWERKVAITRPLEYKTLITKARVKKCAAVSWLLAIVTLCPAYIMEAAGVDYSYIEIVNIVCTLPALGCVIAIIYLYVTIFLKVRKRKDNEISVNALIQAKLETKVAKTTGILTIFLAISFLPAFAVLIGGAALPTLRRSSVVLWTQLLAHLNTLINPILYCYKIRRFRDAILEMLRFKKSQKRLLGVPAHIPDVREPKHSSGLHLPPKSVGNVPDYKTALKRARSMSCQPTESITADRVRSMSAPFCIEPACPVRDPVRRPERKRERGASCADLRDQNKLPTECMTRSLPRSKSWHGKERLK